MTTNDNSPTTNPPDFAAADRLRPIEELANSGNLETVATYIVDATRRINARVADTVQVLLDSIKFDLRMDRWLEVHHTRRTVDPMLPSDELRDVVILLCAMGRMGGAEGEVAQRYAALAVDHARWLAASAWQASTLDEKAVVRRIEQRARIARIFATGWAALAGGMKSDYEAAPTTTYAMALGAEIEAALAPRAVLPEAESRQEEAILDDGWRRRIDALYGSGKLGVGYVAAGRGWHVLVEDALEQIDASLLPDEREAFRVSDVKEKYGTLRIYTDNAPDLVDPIIEVAERRSALTCDRCGDYGRVGGNGWLACRCGRHEQR